MEDIGRVWRKAARRKYISRLARAERELAKIIRTASEREGIDFTAFPYELAYENHLTRRERKRARHLKSIIRRCREKVTAYGFQRHA